MSVELQSLRPLGGNLPPPPYKHDASPSTSSSSSGDHVDSNRHDDVYVNMGQDRIGNVVGPDPVQKKSPSGARTGIDNTAFSDDEKGKGVPADNWILKSHEAAAAAPGHDTATSPDHHVTKMNSDSDSDSESGSSTTTKSGKSSTASPEGCFGRAVTGAQAAMSSFSENYGSLVRHIVYGLLIVGYSGYFAWSLYYEFGSESSVRLLWMTMVANALVVIVLIRDNVGAQIYHNILMPPVHFIQKHFVYFKWAFIVACLAGFIIFLGVDVGQTSARNLISLSGMVIFVLLLFIFSANPAKVRWRPVFWGLGLQFIFALIVLRTSWGYEAFKWLGDRVQEFMLYSDAGAIFVFGENFEDHFFAMKVLPVVVFFSATISVLYYLGTMQTIILKIAWVMQRTLGTTAAESVNAAGNIFIGQTEAPLLIRPMIDDMTTSELHAVMTGGFATIAGSVLATYIAIGVSANHLISASIMAAPCALALSKLSYPETQKSKTTADNINNMDTGPERNVIEAASAGASASISLVANIAVNLMAFISLLTFINTVLTWMGHRAGLWPPEYPELTFELICSYILWPFAFFMGTEQVDCRKVAELIGVKIFLNEFVAYTTLGTIIDNSETFQEYAADNGTYECIYHDVYLLDANVTLYGGVLEPRSITIATYALCGFANLSSIGMVIGALSAMAPTRRTEIAGIALRAMITGTLVSFMNACTAGLLYQADGEEGISTCQPGIPSCC